MMDVSGVPVKRLLAEALEGMERSYSPYSHFSVGAAVWCGKGEVVTGANMENASYGLTVCAERIALWCALMAGQLSLDQPWKAMALVAKETKHGHVVPCGACRQVMAEFAAPDAVVITPDPNTGEPQIIPFSDLLPQAFAFSG